MSEIPQLRSKEQIAGDLIDGILARLRKDIDLNQSSVLAQLIEAISQNMFKASADMIGMIDALSVDRASGEALQRLASDKKVPIFAATAATGQVTITDTSFQKRSTRVYSGQPAPIAGSSVIYVSDASTFSPTGKIYIGRGTANSEGPLDYISAQPESGGAFWSINLAPTSPTTKFHNIGEAVVLAQGGNRIINVGASVRTAPDVNGSPSVFKTTTKVTIIDGETTITNVPVKCEQPGTSGNVPRGAIKEAVGMSFSASIFNENAFINGKDADTDDDIRARIKSYEQAKAKGIISAIEYYSIGVIAKDELKKVASAKVIEYPDSTAALIFDDGTGYEPNFVGSKFETVVDEAVGGEIEVQLRQKPIAQATVQNYTPGPYNLENSPSLAVEINGVQTVHNFNIADFTVPSSATCFEVMSSINGNTSLNFNAATLNGGTSLALYPRDRDVNSIKVVDYTQGEDANDIFNFPKEEILTIRLYKNDIPLFQDGKVARIYTNLKSDWLVGISAGVTLSYIVDNTEEITVTFNNVDFQKIDPQASVSSTTSLETWAKVFNAKMPGVITTIVGERLAFTSARGVSSEASLLFTGGTLLPQIFNAEADLSSTGQQSDFTLNKQTGQIGFTIPLEPKDKITAGSQYARGNVTSAPLNGISSYGRIWFLMDGDSVNIPNKLNINSTLTFSKSGTKLTINSESLGGSPEGFDLAEKNDWLLVWANPDDPTVLKNFQGFWRIEEASLGQIIVDDGAVSRPISGSVTVNTNRIAIIRSSAPMQELNFTPGSLVDFINETKIQLSGVDAEIIGSKIRFSTISLDSNGEIFIAAMDQGGQALNLPLNVARKNIPSHYGFVAKTDSEVGFPSFTYGTLGTGIDGTTITVSNYKNLGGDEADFLEIVPKNNTTTETIIPESNKNERIFAVEYNDANNYLNYLPPSYLNPNLVPSTYNSNLPNFAKRSYIQSSDRYFLRSSYKFDSEDSSLVVADQDAQVKTYTLPVSRKLLVSGNSAPTQQDFSATDLESNLPLNSPSSFNGFVFDNFKVFRQANVNLTGDTFSLKMKAADFGPSGNKMRVGFIYPKSNDVTGLTHTLTASEVIDLAITLPIVEPRLPNWDNTTAFTIEKTTSGAKDILTFTYEVGTFTGFDVGAAEVHVGDVVNIGTTDFLAANKNITGKVTNVTPTSFTVEVPTGDYVSDKLYFTSLENKNGVITVETTAAHNAIKGQRIGLAGTVLSDGINSPINGTYAIDSIVNSTKFTVKAPSLGIGSNITYGVHSNNLVTITTSTAHNLSEGNVILVSNAGTPYNGLTAVYRVLGTNQFQYIKPGSTAGSINTGRVDFQSKAPSALTNITSITKVGNTVTVNTASTVGLLVGDIVRISNSDLADWSSATTYGVNDLVEYLGQTYISLQASNTNNIPSSATAYWQTTVESLNGTFTVNTYNSSMFTFTYPVGGNASATGGTYGECVDQGYLARCLGGQADENLQFGSCNTTAQDIVDYVATYLPNRALAEIGPDGTTEDIIDLSTEDILLSSGYISTTVTNLYIRSSSRFVRFATNTLLPKGADIKITIATPSYQSYSGSYVVIDSYYDPALAKNIIETQSSIIATSSSTNTIVGTVIGSTKYLMMSDGENSIKTTNLAAAQYDPMFQVKKSWVTEPEIGEEIRLVAVTSEQLVRFWNKLSVTGLSNVANINLSKYGKQLQISTKTFGTTGSIQIAGGTSNRVEIATSGSGRKVNNKLGAIQVPFETKKGLLPNQWVTIKNTVRQNKSLGFDTTTTLSLNNAGGWVDITGPGTFQTKRTITLNTTVKFKIEKHGDFMAYIPIAGSSLGLLAGGVKEGDWVRISEENATTDWSNSTTYAVDQRVFYAGTIYASLVNGNIGNLPDAANSTYWEKREFNKGNLGTFQVVRVFGNAFWIKNDNGVEEIAQVGDVNNINFYSYDSVMPGDVLNIATNILSPQNYGRYTVLGPADNNTPFPTPSRIYISPTFNQSISAALGGEYLNVNVEEKDPITLYKKVFAVGPTNASQATVLFNTPELMDKVSASLGATLSVSGKLGFNQSLNFGIDSYIYYQGLVKELNRIIYGDSSDPLTYPGVRAAGTDIDIKQAIVRRITAAFTVRVKTGVPFSEIRENVKAAIAGYVNALGVGQSVSISEMVSAANYIPGVVAVAVTSPSYSSANDLIPVAAFEKAYIVDPTADITVSLISN
jgi:uncharacterized phage protein gp47/JayE